LRTHRTPVVISVAAAIWGMIAAVRYHRLGLTLAHFDARAHLVVARRIFDNLIPGWQQVGAVWLPFPHLLNAFPVQIDYFYRTGYFAVAISILSMAVASWASAMLILRTTGSWVGGACAAALLMLNPDVLYLQSTPMSEPVLFGTTFLAVALTAEWAADAARTSSRAAGWALVAAALSRFEAWPIIAMLILLSVLSLAAGSTPLSTALRRVRGLALWPLWAVAAFLVDSKITVGRWFVASGFFIPENAALGHPWLAWAQVWHAFLDLTGPVLPWIAVAGAVLIVVTAVRQRERAPLILVLSLAASAVLPWGAYVRGHPVILRYGVPLVAACAAIIGAAIALLPRRAQAGCAVVVIALAVWQAPPFDRSAAVITESLRDAGSSSGRQTITAYLRQHWDHQPIMMSMGSLAHYMQDLSAYGFDVRDFLHEGDGEIWRAAMEHPQPFVEWIAIDEIGRGGDALYWRGKRDPAFLAGYARVADGGGVALYRRLP
jgi:hypothetical protein